MSKFRIRVVITLCVFFFVICEYWTGFGYYLKLTSSVKNQYSRRGTKSLAVIDDINHTLNISRDTLADTKAIHFDKFLNKSTVFYTKTNGTNKSLQKAIPVSNITIGKVNSLNESVTAKDRQNRTFYITDVKLHGRLGNHMFQYASLIGISRALKRKLIVAPGSMLQKTFQLHHLGTIEGSETWLKLWQGSYTFDPKLMKLPLKDVQIVGELESFIYFKDVADEVRQEFIFHDYISNEAAMIIDDAHAKNRGALAIGVHVRRGDFLKFQDEGYGVPKPSYFVNAFNWMKSRFPGRNMTFLIASDDLDWCRANLTGNDVVVMPPASPAVHLAVLTSCDHVIISGGTFGWWGGWMAAGHVIYYTGYMANNTSKGKWFNYTEFYPPLWIGLGD